MSCFLLGTGRTHLSLHPPRGYEGNGGMNLSGIKHNPITYQMRMRHREKRLAKGHRASTTEVFPRASF